jgi:hypothetical protein
LSHSFSPLLCLLLLDHITPCLHTIGCFYLSDWQCIWKTCNDLISPASDQLISNLRALQSQSVIEIVQRWDSVPAMIGQLWVTPIPASRLSGITQNWGLEGDLPWPGPYHPCLSHRSWQTPKRKAITDVVLLFWLPSLSF